MKYLYGAFLGIAIMAVSSAAFAVPFETSAKQAILIDVSTNTVLLDKNSDERMPTSSMSKVMTLYVVFDALKQGVVKMDDKFNVSERAWKMGGSRMFLELGNKVRIEDLIQGIAIQSGNDATVVLAEGLAGDEQSFADRMNMKAQELGMVNSHFVNASGWPEPEHYSTARDLSTLAVRTISDFPEYYHFFSKTSFTYNKIYQPNRDPLLGKLEGADGLKTGHTEIAGYGLIGSAQRDGRRLVLVINGLDSAAERAKESIRLLEWGFRSFKNSTLVKADQEIAKAKVWLGEEGEVPLVAERDVVFSVPVFQQSKPVLKLSYVEPIKAPIKKGDALATLKISVPDQGEQEVTLVAGKDMDTKGLFGKTWARLQYVLEN